VALALEVLAVAGFVMAQLRGLFGPVERWLGRVGLRLSRHKRRARASIAAGEFYREDRGG